MLFEVFRKAHFNSQIILVTIIYLYFLLSLLLIILGKPYEEAGCSQVQEFFFFLLTRKGYLGLFSEFTESTLEVEKNLKSWSVNIFCR